MDDPDESADGSEPTLDDMSLQTDDEDGAVLVTSDYDPTFNESVVGSVSSSVYAHVFENGRRYHMYKQGRYPLPNDDKEIGREVVRHALFQELLGGKLHLAPIGQSPHKILDLGTGFGEWATEMGDQYPSAKVVGVDLSPMQPVWVPPNVEFIVEDIEDNAWIHGDDIDYVHLRVVTATLRDPYKVAAAAFEHMRPGGWIEFQEPCPHIGCHDGTLQPDYAVARLFRLLAMVMERQYGWNLYAAEQLPAMLARIGFAGVQRKVLHVPIGLWAKDKKRMHHAFLFREVLCELIPALQAKPLRVMSDDGEEVDEEEDEEEEEDDDDDDDSDSNEEDDEDDEDEEAEVDDNADEIGGVDEDDEDDDSGDNGEEEDDDEDDGHSNDGHGIDGPSHSYSFLRADNNSRHQSNSSHVGINLPLVDDLVDEDGRHLTAADMAELYAQVRAAASAKNVHAYIPFHIVWAQKPL